MESEPIQPRDGRVFTNLLVDGVTLGDPDQRQRLEELAIPAGWKDLWIFRLLDKTGIRLGNPECEARNGSYGLTTLRRRHIENPGPENERQRLPSTGTTLTGGGLDAQEIGR